MPSAVETSVRPYCLASWQETCRSSGIDADASQAVFADLSARYSAPGRFYHTLTHVAAMLDIAEALSPQMKVCRPEALSLAIWFHDAIYDTRAADNEEKSAAYAVTALHGLYTDTETLDRVAQLILATKTHQTTGVDIDCLVLLDADLAILGAGPAEYDAYVDAIRQEYSWVSEHDWQVGRAAVLGRFLERPRIYFTPPMFQMREDQARQNLKREWDKLV